MRQKIGVIQADGSFYPIEEHVQGYMLQSVSTTQIFFQVAVLHDAAPPYIIGDIHCNVDTVQKRLVLSLSRSNAACTITVSDEQKHAYHREEFDLSSLSNKEQKTEAEAALPRTSTSLFSQEPDSDTHTSLDTERTLEQHDPSNDDEFLTEDLSTIEILSHMDQKGKPVYRWGVRIMALLFISIVTVAFGYSLLYFFYVGSFRDFFVNPFAPFF